MIFEIFASIILFWAISNWSVLFAIGYRKMIIDKPSAMKTYAEIVSMIIMVFCVVCCLFFAWLIYEWGITANSSLDRPEIFTDFWLSMSGLLILVTVPVLIAGGISLSKIYTKHQHFHPKDIYFFNALLLVHVLAVTWIGFLRRLDKGGLFTINWRSAWRESGFSSSDV